ncbi:MAG: asparaginase domain-containing protein [Patescibacteria group bacterium]|jgi:L-asparaginase/Glu-tRNA(Gln) amidotransferase subunit D
MTKVRKKITLLLAGGTALLDQNKRLLTIQSPDDIEIWLKQMPELRLLAEVEPIFIAPEDSILTPEHWQEMAKQIAERLDSSSGFVVVSRSDQLLMTANALSFLLQNIKKTVVLTSAIRSGTAELSKNIVGQKNDLGLRSNLINAFQVLDYSLPTPAIMFGTRLIPGVRATCDKDTGLNLFASIDDNYWGRVDFGISVKSGLGYHTGKPKIYNKIKANIFVFDDLPGLTWLTNFEQNNYDALFIKLNHQNKLEPAKIKQIKDSKIPVFLYHPIQVHGPDEAIIMTACTFESAMAKAMWAMANKDKIASFEQIGQQNFIGELI